MAWPITESPSFGFARKRGIFKIAIWEAQQNQKKKQPYIQVVLI